jgi:hypothetical protein
MTLDELHEACIQAAHDVLSAALISLELPQDVGLPEATFWMAHHSGAHTK